MPSLAIEAAALVLVCASVCGCSSETTGPGPGGAGGGGAGGGGGGGGAGGTGGSAELPPTGELPDHPHELPFDYSRPDVGAPLSAAEISAATAQYLEILGGTRWFDTVAHRAHGWPATDPEERYFYATWWSGVSVSRSGGEVTFVHSPDGADNNGLRTAQLLEGACYATALWQKPEHELLTRRLVRGATSWFLAMERQAGDDSFLMARAAYPVPVDSAETPLPLFIDYSASRPGVDAEPSEYIHLPDNPHFPDLWSKNKRSKDDIGHLLRALGEIDTCDGKLTEAGAPADLVEMRRRYEGFSRRVVADDFGIATLDKDLVEYVPSDGLAHFIKFLECSALLSLELTGHGQPIDADCGDAYDPVPEGTDGINSGAMQIVRSFHTAAVQQALVHGQAGLAEVLLPGIGKRLDTVMDLVDAGTPPSNFNTKDLAAFLVHAANAGVPLTSREARWLHDRIAEAHASYLDAAALGQYDLFSPAGADGDYAYEPGGEGIDFKDIGLFLGLCAAQYKNPQTREVLDCAAVTAFSP
jgi:hypothetical protein